MSKVSNVDNGLYEGMKKKTMAKKIDARRWFRRYPTDVPTRGQVVRDRASVDCNPSHIEI